jgi:hypothetical protein
VDLDNRFAVVLATESVVEDSHDASEGSLSPVIGDIHSPQCSGGLFCKEIINPVISGDREPSVS